MESEVSLETVAKVSTKRSVTKVKSTAAALELVRNAGRVPGYISMRRLPVGNVGSAEPQEKTIGKIQ
jgi:hypothetical protein